MHDLRGLFEVDEAQFETLQGEFAKRGAELTVEDQEDHFAISELKAGIEDTNWRKNVISLSFQDASKEERAELVKQAAQLGERRQELTELLSTRQTGFMHRMMLLPNFSASHVPPGESEEDNVTISEHLLDRIHNGPDTPDHLEIGTRLGIIDNKRAAVLSGSKFSLLRGNGATLKRALLNLMLDRATELGYEETDVPFLVRPEMMQGTGQLPKFEGDMFRTESNEGNPLYLIPTTEVPLTNMLRDHTFTEDELSVKLTGSSENFRREAGRAGADTKGLIRNHQFPKVELVRIAHPDTSWDDYSEMIEESSGLLEMLGLPFRTIELCDGDLGIAAHSTRDLEVWLPSRNGWLEVSSVSNTGEFQARRMGMKYKDGQGKRSYVHTLNGTSVAVGRTIAAILENGLQADGSVEIPEVLHDYTKFDVIG